MLKYYYTGNYIIVLSLKVIVDFNEWYINLLKIKVCVYELILLKCHLSGESSLYVLVNVTQTQI